MFTGLIETIGRILRVEARGVDRRLVLAAEGLDEGLRLGDSIALNGICLTVVSHNRPGEFAFDISKETLDKSTAAGWRPGRRVHVERALQLGDRLGGHLVQGHVDGRGRVVDNRPVGGGRRLSVQLPQDLLGYVIPKGSIAIDGVSLTVADLRDPVVTIALVPHTIERTVLGHLVPGDDVNIEVDSLGKYVRRYLDLVVTGEDARSGPSLREALRRSGWTAPGSTGHD